jgi:hypothetical protein
MRDSARRGGGRSGCRVFFSLPPPPFRLRGPLRADVFAHLGPVLGVLVSVRRPRLRALRLRPRGRLLFGRGPFRDGRRLFDEGRRLAGVRFATHVRSARTAAPATRLPTSRFPAVVVIGHEERRGHQRGDQERPHQTRGPGLGVCGVEHRPRKAGEDPETDSEAKGNDQTSNGRHEREVGISDEGTLGCADAPGAREESSGVPLTNKCKLRRCFVMYDSTVKNVKH